MQVASPEDAVQIARRLLGLPGNGGTAYRVRRLDRPREAYFIVHANGHLAALDEATGDLLASAETSRSTIVLTREAALATAGLDSGATAELAWAPGAISQSMFDPVWAVTSGTTTRYVDQRGRRHDVLPAKRPGGGF